MNVAWLLPKLWGLQLVVSEQHKAGFCSLSVPILGEQLRRVVVQER